MSSKPASIQALKGIDLAGRSQAEQHALFTNVLQNGIYGLCFSAYEEGQQPGSILSAEQVRRRLSIIAPHIRAVRTFSCIEGNELIAKIAKEEFGLQTLVGAWLGKDKDLNEEEIEAVAMKIKEYCNNAKIIYILQFYL